MKKILLIAAVAIMTATSVQAQTDEPKLTLNTRAWSTNYFTSLIYSAVVETVCRYAIGGNKNDSLWAERIIPSADLVFPIGMGKKGFGENDIGPYHYAFGNPFKHIGDYAIGLDVSYKPSYIGFYFGTYFKSQEVVFKETDDNIRGFYIQPRAGLLIGHNDYALEAGAFYDVVTGCGGSVEKTNKNMLKSGFGLDFGLTHYDEGGASVLQFSMPLHNFFDTSHAGQEGLKRKVGYIMFTRRVTL